MTNKELARWFSECRQGIAHCEESCPFAREGADGCRRRMNDAVERALAGMPDTPVSNNILEKHRERIRELEESNKGFIAEIEEQDRKIAYFKAVIKSIDALTDSTYGSKGERRR